MDSPTSSRSLPKLPGYSVEEPAAANYTKRQTLQFKNGYAVPVPLGPEQGAPRVAELQEKLQHWTITADAASAAAFTPKYVENDNKVLRLFGYFKEAVPDSPAEPWRARRVQLLHYLTDDTWHITERTEPNSGIQQGTLVRRHQVPRSGGGGGVYGLSDLVVGSSVSVYGREVHLVDADPFTRAFFNDRGAPLAPALPYPDSPLDQYRAARSKPSGLSRSDPDSPSQYAEALLGREHNSKSLQQFLQHGGEVLRFFAVWDDRAAPYGDRHFFKLHFFVADSTAEIMEVAGPHGARGSGGAGRVGTGVGTGLGGLGTFLKRGPLPREGARHGAGAALPGQARLEAGEAYGPQDLRLGALLPVLGRNLYLYDCDDATRRWYQDNLGFSAELLAPIDVSEPAAPLPVAGLPPPNGFGSDEDSLSNCTHLIPKPPKKAVFSVADDDRIVLRFVAQLEPPAAAVAEGPQSQQSQQSQSQQQQKQQRLPAVDRARRFVVMYFVADGSLAVFEPPVPNSGVQGGKFLERARVKRPSSSSSHSPAPSSGGSSSGAPAYYSEADMEVGAVLTLHSRRFRLVEADAFTEKHMRERLLVGAAHRR